MKKALILASASPRRTEILNLMGIPHKVKASNLEEIIEEHWPPEQTVQELAKQKAQFISESNPEYFVLGSDTVVVLNDIILGKPKSFDEALKWHTDLQGKCHKVYTGIALFKNGQFLSSKFEVTKVYFREQSESDIIDYLNTNDFADKAGAYGIQGTGCRLINKIDGCYYNVVGLPINATIELLKLMD